MSTDSHTPLFVGAQNDIIYIIDGPPSPAPYDGPIPREHGPNVVATMARSDRDAGKLATLFAAAPAMKEALRELLAICRQEFGGTSLDGPSQYRPAMNRARAALAAASTPSKGGADVG